MEKLYTVSKKKPGADCGSDHKLLIAKFRLKLKKAGKTTRPLRYDLNQIPYNYTVGVRNRFKGLDLTDRVPEELWMEVHDIVHGTVIKIITKKKKGKKALNMPSNLGISAVATRLEASVAQIMNSLLPNSDLN